MIPTKFQHRLNLCALIILLSVNTFCLYNSLQIFHFQYSRQSQQEQEEITTQFALISNNFQQTTYWLYMNVKLIFTLLSELLLFIILAFETSQSSKSPRYYLIAAAIMLVFQMIITMSSLWPFSAFSEQGQGVQIRQRQAFETCQSDSLTFSCRFISTMLYMISSSKIFVILSFLSLAALSASNILNQADQQNTKESKSFSASLANQIMQKESYDIKQGSIFSQLIKKKKSSSKDSSKTQKKNDETKKSIIDQCKIQSHRVVTLENNNIGKQQKTCSSLSCTQTKDVMKKVQTVKQSSKNTLQSFRSSSQSQVTHDSLSPTMGSSFMEDYQCSDVENTWQPNYITFTARPPVNQPKMSCESSFSTIGENTASRLVNPSIGLFGHFLDKSVDQIEIDIQENNQL